MTSSSHLYPIVGSRFRWPAKAILEVLPIGSSLLLEHVGLNGTPDPNAIRVAVPRDQLPEASLTTLAKAYGVSRFEVGELPDPIHLGFVPKEIAALLIADGFRSAWGTFVVGAQGGPKVKLSQPE